MARRSKQYIPSPTTSWARQTQLEHRRQTLTSLQLFLSTGWNSFGFNLKHHYDDGSDFWRTSLMIASITISWDWGVIRWKYEASNDRDFKSAGCMTRHGIWHSRCCSIANQIFQSKQNNSENLQAKFFLSVGRIFSWNQSGLEIWSLHSCVWCVVRVCVVPSSTFKS